MVTGVTAVVLWLKMVAVMTAQGVVRLRTRRFRHAEDVAYFGGGKGVLGDPPLAERGQRALVNDLENIPMFLILHLSLALMGGAPVLLMIYAGLFSGARIIHTVAFLSPRQPLRNLGFSLGAIVALAVSAHILVLASTLGASR